VTESLASGPAAPQIGIGLASQLAFGGLHGGWMGLAAGQPLARRRSELCMNAMKSAVFAGSGLAFA
jgi:hypothetical protein